MKNSDIKICPQCGFQLPATAKFCRSCGAKQDTQGINAHQTIQAKIVGNSPQVEKTSRVKIAIISASLVALVVASGGYMLWKKHTPAVSTQPVASSSSPQNQQHKESAPNVEPTQDTLAIVLNKPMKISGTLVMQHNPMLTDGYWVLKLPKKTHITGQKLCDASYVDMNILEDTLPFNPGYAVGIEVLPPKVQGDAEFEVTFQCHIDYPVISAISFVGNVAPQHQAEATAQTSNQDSDKDKMLQGTWSCTTNIDPNSVFQIIFGASGEYEDITNLGSVNHRIGNYRLTQQTLEININKIPELAALQQSPNVSLSEGAEIKYLDSNNLQMFSWSNTNPSDRTTESCKKK